MSYVYFDGFLLGEHDEPEELRDKLVEERRNGNLDDSINITYNDDKDELRIETDAGRVRRPLAIVEDGEPLLTEDMVEKVNEGELGISDLVDKGVVEYLDAQEEENAYVALNREDVGDEHTHMELDPALVPGLSASTVVYANHNRGDRVNYGAKMNGQGLGMYTKNFHNRYDTNADLLDYPQRPIVTTRTYDKVAGEHPSGQNMVIAVSSFEGYNIEDAVIFNKASIDRGLARSHHFRTYTTESRRYWGGQKDSITVPDKDTRGYKSEEAYADLDEHGIINPETDVEEGDVIVGKTSPPKFLGSSEEVKMGLASERETSKTVRHGEAGTVDKVLVTETGEGNKLIKTKVRQERIPELGDKFATRHGQKGVIGLIVPEEDMPFTGEGVTPDIILSTHAIPSRMTVSQLIEIIAGKAAAMRGEQADGTLFHSEPEEELRDELKDNGFRYDGKEQMYNGITGEQMDSEIFIGPGYYLKLHHEVEDKIHARSRGPVTLLTNQPTAGRAREGGLRLGEMEKDVLVGHGAALLLKERFGSDATRTYICEDCGEIAIYDRDEEQKFCPNCSNSDVEDADLPQAFLLLLNELKSLMIDPQLELSEE
ncbi:MAG: DNA-directed RNA polymerase subunit B [Candidatus Nanohaloarchaeota archaeon QJJ-9]|nr:DNA-directed RNA polymerase subunit B [Candidatus Nanohaloarchaeota archaeon QJJ-9]